MRRKTDCDEKLRFFRMGDRISVVNGDWFVTTREGMEGPFRSREHAESALLRLIQSWECSASLLEHQEERKARPQSNRAIDPTIWDRQITMN